METEGVYLLRPGVSSRILNREETRMYPCKRKDGWMELKLGEFACNDGDDGEVKMVFEEVKHLNWKNGLIVEGIEIRTKRIHNHSYFLRDFLLVTLFMCCLYMLLI